MTDKKKNIVIIVFSALAGSLLGGVMVGFTVFYLMGQFFSYGSGLASSNQLNFNILALESIRSGDNEKAIKQLEQEARINLVTVGAFEEHANKEEQDAMHKSINNARQYFERHPFEYMDENEKMLVEQAYSKIEK